MIEGRRPLILIFDSFLTVHHKLIQHQLCCRSLKLSIRSCWWSTGGRCSYTVGRACGQFLPGDPSLFRRKNKWEKSANEAGEKPSSNRDFEDTILKMAEIKKLTSKYFTPEEVKEILMTAEMQCKIRASSRRVPQKSAG